MPWHKVNDYVRPRPRVFNWYEMCRSVSPSEDGSSRVAVLPRSCDEVNKLQLNSSVVNLDNLIKAGEKIEIGDVRNLLTVSDPAEIEEATSKYCQDAWEYIQKHRDELFKPVNK